MKKEVKVKEENGEHFIDLKDLSDFVDPKEVAYYKMEEVKNGDQVIGFTLAFFDKNKKKIYLKNKE